ncbi:MAG: ATPase [Clostridiales bacterium]|nr:ATPase [Clostridiales bacterium]
MDMDMDIMEIIDMMEEAIEKASSVPLTGKIMLDKDELLDYIQEIRLVYPEEMKEAKWVKGERQRILSEAESRAETIQKNAEETQMQLIDEHEITKCAYDQANELVNNAQQQAMEIKADTDQYVDDILNDVEHRLDLLLRKVREDRGYFSNN